MAQTSPSRATVPLHDPGAPDLAEVIASDVRSQAASAAAAVVAPPALEELRHLVDHALLEDERWRDPDDLENLGRVTFLPRYGRSALDLLGDATLMGPCDAVLGADCTLYTMTTLCLPPGGGARPVHLDLRYRPPGYIVGMGVMVLLDDFTPQSGPTRFHPDICEEQPSQEDFDRHARWLEAPAGSACWFDGGAWHDVASNRTDRWRRAILIAMVRPWVRQRFDMARMVAHLDVDTLPRAIHQKLGFDHVAPGSYEEFYLPHATRKAELLRRAVERG